MKFYSKPEFGISVLRIGLAIVYLWFGFAQIFDGASWVYLVPDWAVSLLHIPPAMIVLGNGIFEIVFGGLLALNIQTRISALLLALHLVPIASQLGLTETGIRDFGLIMATFALATLGNKNTEIPKTG